MLPSSRRYNALEVMLMEILDVNALWPQDESQLLCGIYEKDSILIIRLEFPLNQFQNLGLFLRLDGNKGATT